MRIVCQQPHYLPWLGYFDLFSKSDAFVFLDSVQWIRQGRQHRTKILGQNGSLWLTVPIRGHGHRAKQLKDMEVDEQPWAKRHWELVRTNYRTAPHFSQMEALLRPFWEKAEKMRFLADISYEGFWALWEPLGLQVDLHWSSDMQNIREDRNQRVIDICAQVGANEYYSSLGSTRYLDLSQFRAAGISVRWQHFQANFRPLHRPLDLSILDYLAHHPLEELRLALNDREKSFHGAPEEPLPLAKAGFARSDPALLAPSPPQE